MSPRLTLLHISILVKRCTCSSMLFTHFRNFDKSRIRLTSFKPSMASLLVMSPAAISFFLQHQIMMPHMHKRADLIVLVPNPLRELFTFVICRTLLRILVMTTLITWIAVLLISKKIFMISGLSHLARHCVFQANNGKVLILMQGNLGPTL